MLNQPNLTYTSSAGALGLRFRKSHTFNSLKVKSS
jgi:hypothetical protein